MRDVDKYNTNAYPPKPTVVEPHKLAWAMVGASVIWTFTTIDFGGAYDILLPRFAIVWCLLAVIALRPNSST